MKPWELAKTHSLIETAFGASQLKYARESIRSLVDRENYAGYHFRETIRLTKNYTRRYLKDSHIIDMYAEDGEAKRVVFEKYIMKASAHAIASVQSIHALPDILANVAYWGSGVAFHIN